MARSNREKAKPEREEYERSHPRCARPIMIHGRWMFCRCGKAVVHEIRHGSGIVFERPNYYPLAHNPCHMGWAHREHSPAESDGEIMLRLFAVKVMFREATTEDVEYLQKGIPWWTDESWDRLRDVSLEDRLVELIIEMRSLTDLKHPFGC